VNNKIFQEGNYNLWHRSLQENKHSDADKKILNKILATVGQKSPSGTLTFGQF
jgi:hypothetical protein